MPASASSRPATLVPGSVPSYAHQIVTKTTVFETRAFPRNRCLPSIRVSAPILATTSSPIRPISNRISRSASCCRTAPRLTSQSVLVLVRSVLWKPFNLSAPFCTSGRPARRSHSGARWIVRAACRASTRWSAAPAARPPPATQPPVRSCCGAAVRPPVPQP